DRVVEVHGAWIARVNQVQLGAGLGKHDNLRLGRDLQGLQQRGQVAVLRVERQLQTTGVNAADERRNRIARGTCEVLDRWMIELVEARVAKLRRSHAGECE